MREFLPSAAGIVGVALDRKSRRVEAVLGGLAAGLLCRRVGIVVGEETWIRMVLVKLLLLRAEIILRGLLQLFQGPPHHSPTALVFHEPSGTSGGTVDNPVEFVLGRVLKVALGGRGGVAPVFQITLGALVAGQLVVVAGVVELVSVSEYVLVGVVARVEIFLFRFVGGFRDVRTQSDPRLPLLLEAADLDTRSVLSAAESFGLSGWSR